MSIPWRMIPASPGWKVRIVTRGASAVSFPVVAWAHHEPYSESLEPVFAAEGGFVGLIWAYEDFRKELDPTAPTGYAIESITQEARW